MEIRRVQALRHLMLALVFSVVLAILPVTPDPAGDIKILVYELGAFAALALWLFTPPMTSPARRKPSALVPLFATFLILNLLAGLVSVNMGYSLARECVKWSALVTLFLVCADVFNTPKQAWRLIATVCVAVAIASLYGIVQFLGWDPFPWNNLGDMLRSAPATFGNPNFASHVLLPATILAVGLCTQPRGRWAIVCVALFLSHFALTQTRGSLLALGGTLFFAATLWAVSRRVKRAPRAIAITLCTVCVSALVGLFAVGAAFTLKTGQAFPDDASTTYRYHSFFGACRLIQDKPWLGHGPGMYRVVNPAYWSPLEKQRFQEANQMNFHVHNEPLEIAVEAGIAAAVAYLGILIVGMYYGVMMGFQSRDPARRRLGFTLATFFLAFLVDGFFGFNVHVPASAVLVCIVAGVTAGVWREREEPIERAPMRLTWAPVLWRTGLLVAATVMVTLGVRDFGAQFYSQRGKGALHHEAHAAAAQSFHSAKALAPFDWLHPYDLGGVVLEMNRPDEGSELLAQSLALNPHFVSAQFRRGKALLNAANAAPPQRKQERLAELIPYAAETTETFPSFPDGHDVLGRAYFLLANWHLNHSNNDPEVMRMAWRAAEEELHTAVMTGSEHAENLNSILALARLAREEVPDTDPNVDATTMHLYRAKILYAAYGKDRAAERVFLHTVDTAPERVGVWAGFYSFAAATDRLDLFARQLRRAVAPSAERAKDIPPLVRAVARGFDSDRDAAATAASELIVALNAHLTAGQDVQDTAALFGWAADALTERAERSGLPKSSKGDVFYQLGLVYEAGNDIANAIHAYDRAATNAPTHFEARFSLAQALQRDEQWDKARTEYEAILDLISLNEEGRRVVEQKLNALPD